MKLKNLINEKISANNKSKDKEVFDYSSLKEIVWRDLLNTAVEKRHEMLDESKNNMIKLKFLIEKKKKWPALLTSAEYDEARAKFGPSEKWQCSFGKDKNGYFCYTHRARSKSKESVSKIPIKDFKFISSTS
jgi:hypothetical protein